jgi:ATP-binding protein involved in chromosome partitioning
MAQQIEGVSRILAVASGKGGVGKTTITVNLALALALRGARVGLFDADLYGPNVPLMLGVRLEKAVQTSLPITRVSRVPYIKPLERYGLKVMSIGLLLGEEDAVLPDPNYAGLVVTQTLVDVVWGELDYLLVDMPPGSGTILQNLTKAVRVDGAIVVTTPQDLSLLDAGRSLGLFRQTGVPILGVVENMSYLICPHCGEPVEVFHRSDREWAIQDEELEWLGRIPIDIGISRGIDVGYPLVETAPDTRGAAVVREIAGRVVEKMRNLGKSEENHGR